MSDVYNSIMSGLKEAIQDAENGGISLKRTIVTVVPLKEYRPDEIKRIRNMTGFSQKAFASYMGVSHKTVEAWEAGSNHPSGAASRLLAMMEMNHNLTKEFPFVKVTRK